MSLRIRVLLMVVGVYLVGFAISAVLTVRTVEARVAQQATGQIRRIAAALGRTRIALNERTLGPLSEVFGCPLALWTRGASEARLVHTIDTTDDAAIHRRLQAPAVRPGEVFELAVGGRSYWASAQPLEGPPGGPSRWIAAMSDRAAARQTARAAARQFVGLLLATAAALGVATYAIMLRLTGRIGRLARRVAASSPEPIGPVPRHGDELERLNATFAALQERLAAYQRQLVEQARLATTGKLAASVVHEVRNPLSAIKLTAQMLAEASLDDERRRQGFDVILTEIGRLGLLCDELLTLAGRRQTRRQRLDLAEIVHELRVLLEPQLRRCKVALDDQSPRESVELVGDRDQLKQMLLNLLLNAIEASSAESTITLTLTGDTEEVAIELRDHGPGFPPAVRAAEPETFWSTKQTGGGIGLAVVRKIVQNHGGTLELCNAPDGGAVVRVHLPRSDGETG